MELNCRTCKVDEAKVAEMIAQAKAQMTAERIAASIVKFDSGDEKYWHGMYGHQVATMAAVWDGLR